ncbi:hypothetical protein T440DRAFT_467233 [Plenodomus tracheiphilus IPT5]|uniref:Uncharacterized protein n=1 Tax=Plenodomus tracheiphilus IPT5 TaxID=1408161 RepID=A0A6A7BB77_9PLEO|nr:hypothetical protein T440DRAFT_467233 [Plenodomus tracheiphilus IPT5]
MRMDSTIARHRSHPSRPFKLPIRSTSYIRYSQGQTPRKCRFESMGRSVQSFENGMLRYLSGNWSLGYVLIALTWLCNALNSQRLENENCD